MATEWIVAPERRRLTPNLHPADDPRNRPVEFVVLHYTAGYLPGATDWLCNPQSEAGAHFVVSKSGDLHQLAPLTARTWHAGGTHARPSIWPGDGAPHVNDRSIGIELENLGLLRKGLKPGTWLSGLGGGTRQGTEPLIDLQGSPWDPWPEDQLAALGALLRRLAVEFPILATWDRYRIVGHCDVDPGRKIDPGPRFPWSRLRALIAA